MATASTFSYAQAAKGQGSPATTPMQETNGQVPDSKESSAAHESSTNGAARPETTEENTRPTESGETVPPQEVESRDSATSRLGSRREDDDATTEVSARRSDKSAARSPSASTRVTDDNESKKGQRKGRKGKNGDAEKKGKDAEKEKEKEQPKIELIEATIPSVNIWAQRKEAQAAKAPAKSNTSAPPAARPEASAAGQDAESKKKTKASEPVAPMSVQHSSAHGSKNQKKGETDGDASTRRSAPRGSRVGGGLPAVGDASSWPTPETATKEEKPKTAERTEKTETQEDANASKSRRREWERIDFVPTVNWETHIPAPRGTRGGRSGPGSRAGRDVPTRGGHSTAPASVAEKPADATPAPAKNAGAESREKRDGASNRGNSVAPAASKAPVADAPRSEQRKTSAPTKGSKTREGVPSSEPSGPRGEGRGERGRGGFRGRGGGHGAGNTGHGQNFMANGTAFAPSSGPRGGHFMSPPLGQGTSFQGHGASQGRGGRGNRGQSAGYRANGPNGSARPRPLSTVSNFAPYQWDPNYAGMPMTAPPYPPQQQQQPFNFELKAILTQQVEFYFSLENLCKDQFLRSHMDGQGFVPLSVIRGFHRVSKLCSDNHNLLRAACADMTQVDFVVSNDGVERLRSRQHWPMFILPVEQRDAAARNNGPESVMFFNHDAQQLNGMMGGAYGVGPVPYMNGNGVDESIPYMNGSHHADGNGQLSATVPEFQPSTLNSPVNDQEDQGKTTVDAPNGSVDSTESVKQLANGIHSDFQPSQTLQS